MTELLGCPFCGGAAEIERYGDRRSSTVYRCTFCSCSLETGEEWDHGADWNRRAVPAGYAPASEVQRAREEALVAGWEACRLSVYAVCEDAREKALNGLTDDAGDHEYGFYSGEANLAKSIARGFNSMEACDDNNLAAARRALAAPPAENGEG